jgi:putative SOS response-associated peptidase YedK
MCGRFTLRRDLDSVCRELRIERAGGSVLFEPRYNIAPTQQTPILTMEPEHGRVISPMVWGIPGRGIDRKAEVRHINARAEHLLTRILWRRATRCAVIADGFYEWSGSSNSARQPFFFHRQDDGLILMAGLYQWHRDEEGYVQTFAIITTPANSAMMPIHDRMPAILEGDSIPLWLYPKIPDDGLLRLLVPAPDDLLVSWPVSLLVNDHRNDDARLIEPRE